MSFITVQGGKRFVVPEGPPPGVSRVSYCPKHGRTYDGAFKHPECAVCSSMAAGRRLSVKRPGES